MNGILWKRTSCMMYNSDWISGKWMKFISSTHIHMSTYIYAMELIAKQRRMLSCLSSLFNSYQCSSSNRNFSYTFTCLFYSVSYSRVRLPENGATGCEKRWILTRIEMRTGRNMRRNIHRGREKPSSNHVNIHIDFYVFMHPAFGFVNVVIGVTKRIAKTFNHDSYDITFNVVVFLLFLAHCTQFIAVWYLVHG